MVKIGGTRTAMDPWKLRLEAIKERVQRTIEELQGEKTETTLVNLRTLTLLFIEETRSCMDKLEQADIVEYTEIQLNAQLLTTTIPETVHQHQAQSKLPKLELPKFNGDILKWSEFWDRFSSSIDVQNLSNADKLSYLQSALGREALAAIEGLNTTNDNYHVAVEILKGRFGKPGLVIDAHYEALFNIRRATCSPKDCLNTFNELEKHLRVLMTMGEDVNHNNLRTIILGKFPNEVIYELKKKIKLDEENVEVIRKELENIIMAKTVCDEVNIKTFSTEQLHIQSRPVKQRRPFLKRKYSENRNHVSNKKPKLSFIFCEEIHFNDECKNLPTIEERKKKLDRRCFICFRNNHTAKSCKIKRKCVHCGQMGKHNRAICPAKFRNTNGEVNILHVTEHKSILQTAVVMVLTKDGTRYSRILLDTGSQRSYMLTSLATLLDVQQTEVNHLLVYTFGSDKPTHINSTRMEVTFITKRGFKKTIEVNLVPAITKYVQVPTVNLTFKNFLLADDGSCGSKIDILIGNDYYYSFIRTEKLQLDKHLFLVDSDFGWIYSGAITQQVENQESLTVLTYFQSCTSEFCHFSKPDPPMLDTSLTALWELEVIGIRDSPKSTVEEEAVRQFNESVVYKDGRYQVKWPWADSSSKLPTNFGMAFGRLHSLVRRTDRSILEKYDMILKEQEQLGIIEKVKDHMSTKDHPVHYLPHHHVVKQDSNTKLRIVYDASAKPSGSYHSLNELLHKGPLLLEDLTGLLLRFRQHEIAITADIEKAFLQLGLDSVDRDVTRFLWLRDYSKGTTEDNLICYRFCRVPFGVISSPFLLNATIRFHLHNYKDSTLDRVANNIYVDNLVISEETIEDGRQSYKKSKEAFEDIGMNIRQWNSNSQEFVRELSQEQQDNNENTSVLGVEWNVKSDTIRLKITKETFEIGEAEITKRKVLSTIASIYDPCGFATPTLLKAKIFIQDLWKAKHKWDKPLPEETVERWHCILQTLKSLNDLILPRYVGIPGRRDVQKYELHCFTDSSMQAYATVLYLKLIYPDQVKLAFLMAKSRLAPIKEQEDIKIPRLELLGCLIGSRLLRYVKDTLELTINGQYLWTDSQIVINWLKSDKLLPPFVNRRVIEIRKRKEVQILYVETKNNPADIATRTNEHKEEDWFLGPKFLYEKNNYNDNWSLTQNLSAGEGLIESEDNKEQLGMEEIGETLRQENRDEDESQETQKEETEDDIIRKLQQEHYPKEVAGERTSLARSLDLFKDENDILRCKGRLSRTEWSYEKKHPILLPRNCDFTNKLIQKIHEENYHTGVSHTLSNVRELYWIPKGRAQVQISLKRCRQCIRHGGGPFKLPPMPPLPPERVTYSRAFSYVGLDYLGPINVQTGDSTIAKRWVCLFTCMAVRAVHLEVVRDLTAEEFLLALRRMIAVRGVPVFITSDNATHFKLSSEVLTGPYCIENKIIWKFIPELAPWHGGFYERLVALVKHCLKRTIDKHLLNENQLITIIKEIETVLNTRPLTYVGSELEHVLKPIDFLTLGACLQTKQSGQEYVERGTLTKNDLIESWKRGQVILKEFIEMFRNQYLVSIRERWAKNKEQRVTCNRIPKIGEVVQIKGDSTNRSCWKIGKVVSVEKGHDTEVRVAKVSVDGKLFTRSISHLYPLELEESESREKDIQENINNTEERTIENNEVVQENEANNDQTTQRSRRSAAERARKRIEGWTKQLLILNDYE